MYAAIWKVCLSPIPTGITLLWRCTCSSCGCLVSRSGYLSCSFWMGFSVLPLLFLLLFLLAAACTLLLVKWLPGGLQRIWRKLQCHSSCRNASSAKSAPTHQRKGRYQTVHPWVQGSDGWNRWTRGNLLFSCDTLSVCKDVCYYYFLRGHNLQHLSFWLLLCKSHFLKHLFL